MHKKLSAFLLALALCASAQAQTLSGGGTLLSEIAPHWHMGVGVEAMGDFAIPADISNTIGGDVGVYSTSVNVKAQGAWDMRHFLTFSLDYSYNYYDFSSPDAPFSSMNRTGAMLFYTGRIDERWGVFTSANLSLGSAIGESLWEGAQFSVGAGATYAVGSNLTVGFGGMAYSRLDNNWTGFPIAFIDWKLNDRLRFRTFAGGAFFYDVLGDGSLILTFSGEYKNLYYRLARNAYNERQSVCDSYIQIKVGATYHITKHAYVSASVGGNFWRDFQMRAGGDKSERIDVDAAPMFMVQAGWLF